MPPPTAAARTCFCLLGLVAVTAASTASGPDCSGRVKRDIMFPIYNEPPSFYDHSHGHRHHPHLHHPHSHGLEPQVDLRPSQMPSSLMEKLNEVNTVEDFMKLVSNMPNSTETAVVNRFGDEDDDEENVDRNSVSKRAQAANCIPENVTIPLHINLTDPNEMYYPTCTRVKRCGGCCSTALLSCQPTKSETINLNVMVTGFKSGSVMLVFKREEVVPVEQHISCKCGCKLKAKHCNPLQVYKKRECRCECTNVDDMQKCLRESDIKLWDYNSCACTCRTPRECTTGFFFNPMTCGCMEIPISKRRASEIDKRRRRGESERPWFHPRPVVPLSQAAVDYPEH